MSILSSIYDDMNKELDSKRCDENTCHEILSIQLEPIAEERATSSIQWNNNHRTNLAIEQI